MFVYMRALGLAGVQSRVDLKLNMQFCARYLVALEIRPVFSYLSFFCSMSALKKHLNAHMMWIVLSRILSTRQHEWLHSGGFGNPEVRGHLE